MSSNFHGKVFDSEGGGTIPDIIYPDIRLIESKNLILINNNKYY